jgi:acetyl esterase/lipase
MPITAHYDQPYANTQNRKQMLDLYLPKDRKEGQKLPLVVFIHGGGWINGDRVKAAAGVLRLVRTGNFAGAAISYRLSGEAKWPAQIHDCKAAIRWLRAHADQFGLDADRIGVWGSSAGGHLVSMLGTSAQVKELEGDLGEHKDESSRVTCVVNVCGPQDFLLELAKGEKIIKPDPAVVGLLGTEQVMKREALVAVSPATYVSADDAPFMHLHGTKDPRVDFKHAERIHAALTTAKVPSHLVPVVDGGHSLKHPGADLRILAFFDRYLRGQNADIPGGPLQP